MYPPESGAEAAHAAEPYGHESQAGSETAPGAPSSTVSPQITDALTQANVTSLGIGPAFAIVQSFLAHSQAQGVLFANMVQEHQQLSTAGLAATVQSVIQILGTNNKSGGTG